MPAPGPKLPPLEGKTLGKQDNKVLRCTELKHLNLFTSTLNPTSRFPNNNGILIWFFYNFSIRKKLVSMMKFWEDWLLDEEFVELLLPHEVVCRNQFNCNKWIILISLFPNVAADIRMNAWLMVVRSYDTCSSTYDLWLHIHIHYIYATCIFFFERWNETVCQFDSASPARHLYWNLFRHWILLHCHSSWNGYGRTLVYSTCWG